MKRLLPFLPCLLIAIAIGCIAGVALHCALAFYRGDSPDPRCVYNWKGYHEIYGGRGITCEYRPRVGHE